MKVSKRALLWFWASVAAAVFLLGGGVSTAPRAVSGGDGEAVVLFVLALLGFAAAMFVAGRIALVAARVRRAERRR